MHSNDATFFHVLALLVDIQSLRCSGCEGTEHGHLHSLYFELSEKFVLEIKKTLNRVKDKLSQLLTPMD